MCCHSSYGTNVHSFNFVMWPRWQSSISQFSQFRLLTKYERKKIPGTYFEPCKFRIFQNKSKNLWICDSKKFQIFCNSTELHTKNEGFIRHVTTRGDMWMGWKTRCRSISNKELMHIRITNQWISSSCQRLKGRGWPL